MGDRCVLNHSSLADKFDNNVEFHEIARVLKIPSRHYGGGKWGLSPYTLPTLYNAGVAKGPPCE